MKRFFIVILLCFTMNAYSQINRSLLLDPYLYPVLFKLSDASIKKIRIIPITEHMEIEIRINRKNEPDFIDQIQIYENNKSVEVVDFTYNDDGRIIQTTRNIGDSITYTSDWIYKDDLLESIQLKTEIREFFKFYYDHEKKLVKIQYNRMMGGVDIGFDYDFIYSVEGDLNNIFISDHHTAGHYDWFYQISGKQFSLYSIPHHKRLWSVDKDFKLEYEDGDEVKVLDYLFE